MRANLFYRNPRLTVLCIGLILVAGFGALHSLPRQEDPTLTKRFGNISTFFPGASALRVETLVTERIESALLELHEIRHLDSLSRNGLSSIKIELLESIDEDQVDAVWSRVRDQIDDAERELPPGALAPELEEITTTAATLVVALVWEQDDRPQLDILTRLAEELENRLRNLPHTEETELYGEAQEEVLVSVDAPALAALGLTSQQVSAAIAQADSKVPAGQLRHASNDLLIEVAGELDSLARIRSIPLRRRPDGRFLRLGDVAQVSKSVREPAETLVLVAGRPGLLVSVTMEPFHRVDHWALEAHRVVEEFRAEVPAGVSLETVFDQSGYTEERLATLAFNLLLGALIVVAVLFFTMGARSALIVSAALPLTLAAVLAEMNAIGMPLHQTSVTGLIIALGLLIDNAIVVVDDFNEHLRNGKGRAEAVAHAVRHLFVPLLASTLTTALAFLPIVLMPGGAGEFVGPISVGVILSVITSYALSMTVIPSLAARLAPAHPPGPGAPWWQVGYTNDAAGALYRRSLALVLRRPAIGVAVPMLLPIVGFVMSQNLVEQFFPPNDRNQFQLQLILPSQTSLAATREQALLASQLVDAHPQVRASHWVVGGPAPRVFYTMLSNEDGVSSYAGAFVTTESPEATEGLLPELQRELMQSFPNALALAIPFEQGPPIDAPIELRVFGPDLDELRRLGDELRGVLAASLRVTYTRAKLQGGEPKLMLQANEYEAGLAGLGLTEIAEQLQGLLEGSRGGSLLEANEELPVRVRVAGDARADLQRIVAARLQAAGREAPTSARHVSGTPLRALAEVALVTSLGGVTRRDGERSNTVQAFLEPYSLIAESLTDFRRRLEASDFQLPPGYRLEVGGESEQRSQALGALATFALPLFVVMAGTIILSFNSFRFAGVIGVVAFLSIGLALMGVWLFGYPMGFLAIVGTMGLVGLAINGGIVVLSALCASHEARQGDLQATQEVVVTATRHIVATTLTTIGGFIPLILLGGRFWPPLATAIAGGVGGSALLALYLVPALFVLIVRRSSRAPADPLAA